MPRLAEVVELLHGWYPPETAADWDAVGLAAGDPGADVRRVLLAVDPVLPVAREAAEWDADLLLTHHPLFLRGVHGVAETTPKGRTLAALARAGCGLLTAHTNADHGNPGVSDAIARALGLRNVRPVAPSGPALDKIVVYVPDTHAEPVRLAIAEAGAGQIGDYDSCSWTSVGEGRFRPLEGAHPVIGRVGDLELVAEARVEAVLQRSRRSEVVRALLAAHPYEEVAYDVIELAEVPGPHGPRRGHGRIGRLDEPVTLADFADRVGAALPTTAHGVRVAGDPDRRVHTVAVGSGSGDFLMDTVLGTDADVYLTSDLRHHRAAEFREHEGPALVDVAHWAAEWTWLPVVERKLRDAAQERGVTVETRVSGVVTDPWTFRAG
jgi:dinuclear metal center YbgI/SA1388 family protein